MRFITIIVTIQPANLKKNIVVNNFVLILQKNAVFMNTVNYFTNKIARINRVFII